MKRVVIIGGGISGLSTAYYLRRARPDLAITVLDRRDRLGGVITTRRESGFVMEGGPDSFITLKPWGVQLCRDLGIEDRLIPTDPANRKVYVLSRGRLEPLPPGLVLTAPTRLAPFLASRLISWPGKIRMGMDLILPRGPEREDESLGSFVRRRLGREAVDKIAEPILGGIFLAEADRLSLRATFPRLLEMERRHRSLILALRKEGRASGGASPFRSLEGGMDHLVEALRAALPGVEFGTGTNVIRIESTSSVPVGGDTPGADPVDRPGNIPCRVVTDGEALEASALVLAVPPPDCARILRSVSDPLADEIARIPSVSTATVSLGFRVSRSAVPLDGTGFVIARGENRRILACTWSSKKFGNRAPEGQLLVRCFLGDGKETGERRGDSILEQSDQNLVALVREELKLTMGLEGDPVASAVWRWKEANPIYEVGHLDRVRRIEALIDPALNLRLTGSGFRGIGIPDCVGDAIRVASEVAAGT